MPSEVFLFHPVFVSKLCMFAHLVSPTQDCELPKNTDEFLQQDSARHSAGYIKANLLVDP